MSRLLALATTVLLTTAGALGEFSEREPHVAYSLRVARQRIERAGANWRLKERAVLNLAGVTDMQGFVFDASTGDLILVGRKSAGRVPLTLDDLVVALRARFVHAQWPSVSIEPAAGTNDSRMRQVRFEGGIEDTAFGQSLFDASRAVKNMGPDPRGPQTISLYLISSPGGVRGGVCVLGGQSVGEFQFDRLEAPGSNVTQRFDQLSSAQQSLRRLSSLLALVALSKALQDLEDRSMLSWWLEKYPIATPTRVKGLRGSRRQREISGGVHLAALQAQSLPGNEKVLRDPVLRQRPSADELSWAVASDEWLIAVRDGRAQIGEPALLIARAWFLVSQGHHEAALSAVDQALTLSPGLADGWKLKGELLASFYRDREARECFDRALELAPLNNDAWRSKARLLARLGYNEDALFAVNRALELDRSDTGALQDKSVVLTRLGRVPEALECYRRILEINPLDAGAWRMRGLALATLGRYGEALDSLAHTLRLNPRDGEAWYNQALYLAVLKRYDEARNAMRRAAAAGHEVAREVVRAGK